ncbi:MAG: type IV toxin-antitoxin system AbiEi family antitoxin [Nitrospiraceae bacterium]|nr:type IV toxin-antitoxin system AbiEi family antitoxin [Nitrospiraceae bacterium]
MFIIDEQDLKVNEMKRTRDIEKQILDLAIEAFKRNLPGQAQITTEPVVHAGLRPDQLMRITAQGREIIYYAEMKTALTKAEPFLLRAGGYSELDHPLLLVARHVNPQMAEQLKRNGVEFIDAAGNTFINQPPLYIFVKGNKPPEGLIPAPPKRIFRAAGLRVIYAFLCNPGLENRNYREIAVTADVALGAIGLLLGELKETGFLLDMGKRGHKVTQKELLLQRWVTAYPEQLRPKQMIGRYRGEYGWWQNKRLDPVKAQWGGEVAAARLTQYLQPEVITIYTADRHINELLLENRLKKDPAGNVEVLERFWIPGEVRQKDDLVHPILVYADLMATGNERNLEAARMIHEQYIIQLIRED